MAGDDNGDSLDILSGDEESVISMLRRIVDVIRAHGMAADVEAVERAVIEAGASNEDGARRSESRVLRFRSAHFSLTPRTDSGARIEINFHPHWQ